MIKHPESLGFSTSLKHIDCLTSSSRPQEYGVGETSSKLKLCWLTVSRPYNGHRGEFVKGSEQTKSGGRFRTLPVSQEHGCSFPGRQLGTPCPVSSIHRVERYEVSIGITSDELRVSQEQQVPLLVEVLCGKERKGKSEWGRRVNSKDPSKVFVLFFLCFCGIDVSQSWVENLLSFDSVFRSDLWRVTPS